MTQGIKHPHPWWIVVAKPPTGPSVLLHMSDFESNARDVYNDAATMVPKVWQVVQLINGLAVSTTSQDTRHAVDPPDPTRNQAFLDKAIDMALKDTNG